MIKIIFLIISIILIFIFMLLSIYKLFIKRQKNYKYSVLISLLLCIILSAVTIYLTVTKTYNKIVNEGDDLIVKVSSKTGEVTGKSTVAFGKSAYDGVESTLDNQTILAEYLRNKGVEIGKVLNINANTLQVYFIFNKDYNENILVKIKDKNNQEIGRSTQKIIKNAGEAGYIQFNFDKLTNIESQSKIIIE